MMLNVDWRKITAGAVTLAFILISGYGMKITLAVNPDVALAVAWVFTTLAIAISIYRCTSKH